MYYVQLHQKINMSKTALDISDPSLRLTLEVMLKAEGHEIVTVTPEVTVADSRTGAINALSMSPVVLLTSVAGIADAVNAMYQGVYGYILLPLQPGEAGLMVTRAAAKTNNARMQPEESNPALLSLAEVEKQHIEAVLRACKGNQVKASRILGIGRNTLWRKMKSWKQKEYPLL
mgnify:FL=1